MTLGEILTGKEKLSILDYVMKYSKTMTVQAMIDLCNLYGISPAQLFTAEYIER
ncbi:hypothetical protein SPSIL_020160 [Sporomusa silvacetica DSM 10669]|uniref:HTH cro/C1-type domain-containing protein n=1 Tax=Sporomusa silvacetica DSM 10669 TaxID=1123289 RepID=A0ABZ3IJM4_9FIRM|nr:hypothetical protein [Sporomusa silvacetica]OZC18731.1 hypothetical protein SPSIL_23400 [Sporomusa silvacetica DSM 10669]